MTNRLETVFAVVLASLAAVWFICVARVYFMHDDHMYVVTAALLDHHRLYTELVFLQMPLVAYVFAGLLKLFGGYSALIAFNIVVVLVACTLALKSLGGRAPLVLLATWLALMGSFAVITAAGTTSNHALQLFIGSGFMLVIFSGPATLKRALLAGLIYSLMVQAKLNSLPFALPLAAWLWQSGHFWRRSMPVAVAGLVAAIPTLALFMAAPESFWFSNITAPLMNNDLRQVSDSAEAGATLLRQFMMPPVLALLLVTLLAFIKTRQAMPRQQTALWGSFLVAAAIAGLLPGKIFDNHFAMLMLTFCTALGSLLMQQYQHMPVGLQRSFTVFGLLPALFVGVGLVGVSGILRLESGKAATMQQIAVDYHTVLSTHHTCATKIFSTAAIPLLGGALQLHPASASGPFIIRIQTESVITDLMFSRTALVTGYHANMLYEQKLIHAAQIAAYTPYSIGRYSFNQKVAEWTLWLPPCDQ